MFLQVLTGKAWPQQPGQEAGNLPTHDRPSPTPPLDARRWTCLWRYLTHFSWKKIFIFESKIFPLYIDFHKHRRHFPWSFFCPFPDILAMHTENPLVTAEMVNLQSTDIIGDVARYPLVKVHGKFQDDCNIQYFTVHDYRYIAWCFSLSLWNRITNTLKWMISQSKRALLMSIIIDGKFLKQYHYHTITKVNLSFSRLPDDLSLDFLYRSWPGICSVLQTCLVKPNYSRTQSVVPGKDLPIKSWYGNSYVNDNSATANYILCDWNMNLFCVIVPQRTNGDNSSINTGGLHHHLCGG